MPLVRAGRAACLLLGMLLCALPGRAEDYALGPDSMPQEGVPRGEVTQFAWTSKVFPGAQRDVWVYVPKQYDPATPACVMVFQDGGGYQSENGQWRVPVVFDNLIHKKEMPVTIGIFLNPGVVPASSPNALPRYNRSVEYDSVNDQYARFLEEEILPEVGKKYNLTKDPNGRAIGGASSGGICAFTAAWERPDLFRRVFCAIGSFTDLRGGNVYPSLIRKTEPKPLRIFMQDGSNDLDIYSGSWFVGNNDVAAALKFAGYDHRYVVGDGGHDGRHGGAILPDALRWLWRDYPKPIEAAASQRQPVMRLIQPGATWERVGEEKDYTEMAAGPEGVLALADKQDRLFRLTESGMETLTDLKDDVSAIAFGPDGKLFVSVSRKEDLFTLDGAGRRKDIPGAIHADSLIINSQGIIYYSELLSGRLWRLEQSGDKRVLDSDLEVGGAYSLAFTPDQTLLLAVYPLYEIGITSYQVQANGLLAYKQPYHNLQKGTGYVGGMAVDTQGWLYVATAAGIQVCDQAGRVNAILAAPERLPVAQIAFAGPDSKWLYAIAGGRLYRRRMQAQGVAAWEAPVKPPAPRL